MEINKFNFTQCIEVDLNKKLMGGMPCILSTQNCKGHLCSEISQTFCFFLRLDSFQEQFLSRVGNRGTISNNQFTIESRIDVAPK